MQPEVIEETINDTFWIVRQKADQFRGSSLVSTGIIAIACPCALKGERSNPGAGLGAFEVIDAEC